MKRLGSGILNEIPLGQYMGYGFPFGFGEGSSQVSYEVWWKI